MYEILDLETENHVLNKRKGSPWHPDNFIVALGLKHEGDAKTSGWYAGTAAESAAKLAEAGSSGIKDTTSVLVLFNAKFDLLWLWTHPEVRAFLKRGGRIWCCQLAEYLLEGQQQHAQMCSLDSIVEKYGGEKKIDAVKLLWQEGKLTSEIDRDLLMDYLLGRDRNGGDIGNTEKVYQGQLVRAIRDGMLPEMLHRMEALVASTMMEFNGIVVDEEVAAKNQEELSEALKVAEARLAGAVPADLDPHFVFNWSSKAHVSALLFGGCIKYRKWSPHVDADGQQLYAKKTEAWPLFDGEPRDPNNGLGFDEARQLYFNGDVYQDVFAAGKRKGMGKTKNVQVDDQTKPKGAQQDFGQRFARQVSPLRGWETSTTDFEGKPIYSTKGENLQVLAQGGNPIAQVIADYAALLKELTTYYRWYDVDKDEYTGMLTMLHNETECSVIHHNLNHVITVTTRLSSSEPNLQNIPRADKSKVKEGFVSRFKDGEGRMLEFDYSQLEVIGQAVLTNDQRLIEDINSGIDFHCKRVSLAFGIPYEQAVYLCKDESAPEHKVWKTRRTKAKIFSFQRAYGAGSSLIALTTGMAQEEVEAMIELEEQEYPGIPAFFELVKSAVESTPDWRFFDAEAGISMHKGQWQAFTGTKYIWRQYPAKEWQRKRGIRASFSPTEMKNYPVQGTSGEFVQIAMGMLARRFIATNNYDGKAYLINTVHDCFWVDCHKSVLIQVCADLKRILEAIPMYIKETWGIQVPVKFPTDGEIGFNMHTMHGLKDHFAAYPADLEGQQFVQPHFNWEALRAWASSTATRAAQLEAAQP